MEDNNYYDLFFSDVINNNFIYKSKVNSNLMYVVNKDIKSWDFLNDNPFEIQNDFVSKSFGKDDVLEFFNDMEEKNLSEFVENRVKH